jgi:hypothetical protein
MAKQQAAAARKPKEPTVCIPEVEHKRLIEENAMLRGYYQGQEDAKKGKMNPPTVAAVQGSSATQQGAK